MPKSKRQKIVTLTKTEKKGKEAKTNFFTAVRESADAYPHVYVFAVEHMRNVVLKELRTEMKDTGRFFLGKNKVMVKALGGTMEEEYKENFHQVAEMIEGSVGLFMSTLEPEQVKEIFDRMRQKDYARTGCRATHTIVIPAGPVKQGDHSFPNNMEVQLRQLGMPTRLAQGVVTLDKDYTICNEGDVLNANQSQLLKHFYIQMAEFRIVLKAHWFNGQLERLSG